MSIGSTSSKGIKVASALVMGALLVVLSTASTNNAIETAAQATMAPTDTAMQSALPACPPVAMAATMASTDASMSDNSASMSATSDAMSAAATSATSSGAAPTGNTGYLGVSVVRVDDCGARIVLIIPGGPAAASQLQIGDVIVAFNGKPYTTLNDLIGEVTSTAPGTKVTLSVQRATGTTRSAATPSAVATALATEQVPDNPNLVQIEVPVTIGQLTPSLAMTATKFAGSVLGGATATPVSNMAPSPIPSATVVGTTAATMPATPAGTSAATAPVATAVATQ